MCSISFLRDLDRNCWINEWIINFNQFFALHFHESIDRIFRTPTNWNAWTTRDTQANNFQANSKISEYSIFVVLQDVWIYSWSSNGHIQSAIKIAFSWEIIRLTSSSSSSFQLPSAIQDTEFVEDAWLSMTKSALSFFILLFSVGRLMVNELIRPNSIVVAERQRRDDD